MFYQYIFMMLKYFLIRVLIDLEQGSPTFCGSRAKLHFHKYKGAGKKKKNDIIVCTLLYYKYNIIKVIHTYVANLII